MHPFKRLWRYISQDLLLGIVIIAVSITLIVFGAPIIVVLPALAELLFFLVFIMSLYIWSSYRLSALIAAINAGQPQVRWSYQPEEWRSFISSPELAALLESQVRAWQPWLMGRAIRGGIIVFVINLFIYRNDGIAGIIAAAVLGLVLFGILARSAQRMRQSLRHPYGADSGAAPPQIVISAVGVNLGEQVMRFHQPRLAIRSADILPGAPASIRIQLEYTLGRKRIMAYTLMIPIPSGGELEAELIRQQILRG